MSLEMQSTRLFFLVLAGLFCLACSAPETARAGGSYVYFYDYYETDPVDETDDTYAWCGTHEYGHAWGGEGSAAVSGNAYAWVSIDPSYNVLWSGPGASVDAYCQSWVGYEWEADPQDPNEIPPGGSLDYSVSASGGLSADGSCSCAEFGWTASSGGSGSSSGGGEGTSGYGSVGGDSSCDALGESADYSSSFSPEECGSASGEANGSSYQVSGGWGVSAGDSDIPIEEGTTLVYCSASCGGSAYGGASASWNGQDEGSAGGDGYGYYSGSASISISFP